MVLMALPGCALMLSGCENVTGFSEQSLVRVIDASYNAPAIDVYIGSDLTASNVGQGTITNYADVAPSTRVVHVDTVGTTKAIFSSSGTFRAGHQHSVFLTDYNSTYQVTVLEDQTIPAPSGKIAVRFLQQAPSSGPVDVYMVPDGTTFSDAKPILSGLAVGATTAYIQVPAETLDLIIVPTGTTTPRYTSAALTFVGGEVRTYLIVDAQLTTNPPINVYTGKDVN